MSPEEFSARKLQVLLLIQQAEANIQSAKTRLSRTDGMLRKGVSPEVISEIAIVGGTLENAGRILKSAEASASKTVVEFRTPATPDKAKEKAKPAKSEEPANASKAEALEPKAKAKEKPEPKKVQQNAE